MKKRSLLTAVVMLVVSAILLTSSTYAWFAAQHESTVEKVTATVSGTDAGNVQVSLSNSSGWTTKLNATDFIASTGTKALDPVDIDPFNANALSYIKVADYDSTNYTIATNPSGAAGRMLDYTWYVRATSRGSNTQIVIPTTFSAGSCLYGIIYIDDAIVTTDGTAVADGGTPRVWGNGGNDSYYYLNTVTAATDDASGTAGIVDAADTKTGALASTATQANTNGATSVNLTIDISSESTPVAHKVRVVVWAEGQDSNCVGGVSVTDGGFTFGVENVTNGGIHLGA